MKKRFSRVVFLFLAMVLTLQMSGVLEVAAYDTVSADETVGAQSDNLTVLGEDISKRSESVKHFRMSDGSFMAVSYGVPVHYEDEHGEWQDINNIPIMTTSASDAEVYQIANAGHSISFSSTLADGEILSISYEDKSIWMSLLDTAESNEMTAEKQTKSVLDTVSETVYDREATAQYEAGNLQSISESESQNNNEAIIPSALSSSVIYQDVYPGVDIRYTTWSYTVKEEIIVKEKLDSYRYDFLLKLSGLVAIPNADGSISMIDSTETEIFKIPAPYMVDAAGAFSNLVSYEITEVDEGIVLTVEADKAWIESEDRLFPISIDPTVGTSEHDPYNSENDEIYSTFVHPSYQTSSLYTSSQRYTGFGGSNATSPYIVYLYFNNLPKVPVGSFISNASVKIFYSDHSSNGCNVMPIGLFPVTDPIPENQTPHQWFKNINYSNKPAYSDENIIDFFNASKSNKQRFISLDITELAQGWYSGENNRTVALAPIGTYSNSYSAWQYYVMSEAYYCPVMTVTYRNYYGLEDYYTYQSMSAGEAGTAYIADATGQLKIVKNLITDNSAANPYSINLVYNSDYFVNSSEDYIPPMKMGLNMSVGSGWTLDCIQTTEQETIGTKYYIKHRDGDGTIHYYRYPYSNAPCLYDEDGLGLSMTQSGMDWNRIYDRLDNYLMFDDGVMEQVVDWNGNSINIQYVEERITSITRKNKGKTEVTLATFEYIGDSLSSVTDAAGNTYTLNYNEGKLTSIHKNNALVAQFDYSGYHVKKMLDCQSGYALNFNFNTSDRIEKYFETANNESGAAVLVTYPGQNQTTYRDPGPDQISGNGDDLLHHYLFDFAGRTINAYVTATSDGITDVYGTSSCAYTDSNSTDRTTNRILRSASTGNVAQQLLRHTSLETGNWSHGGTVVSAEKPRTGEKSIKGTTSNVEEAQYAQTASEPLNAGVQYTLSCYVNTEGMEFEGKGIYLKVEDSNGKVWTGDAISYATNGSVDSGWVRLSVTFTAETNGVHNIAICREGATGTFYADDFQLEMGEAPSSYNMVENGAMSYDFGWTMGSGAAIGTNVLTITGNPTSSDTAAWQEITVNASGMRTYVLSGWAKTNGVADTVNTTTDPAQDTNKQCGLRAVLTYSDGAKEYHYVPFNTDVHAWQFVSYAIVPKEPDKIVSTIRVVCAFEGNVKETSFDNISLIQEVAQSMSYDENGMLETVATTGLGADKDTYNGYRLLRKRETAGYGTYSYDYYDPDNGYRLTHVSNGYVTERYHYSDVGNLTTTTLSGSGNKKITTSNGYSSDGNLLTSVTDASGAAVTYTYGDANSQMLGLPTAVTAPNGTVTNTVYDTYSRVTETSVANLATLLYNYTNGYLSSITREDSQGKEQVYTLTNDAFGKTTEIRVGERLLASYVYNQNNGSLISQTDGNGDTVSFEYDYLGRVIKTTYSSGLTLTYAYSGEGYLYSVTAAKDNDITKYIYTYDTNGRVIASERQDGGESVLRTRQSYDTVNRLDGQIWQIGEDTYSESYTYNSTIDGSLNTMTLKDGSATIDALTMGYDGLRRLSSITGGIYDKTYTYRDISSTQTTGQVASLTYDLPVDQTFAYTYDVMGNIAAYTDANGTVEYTYDPQGQLLSAVGDQSYTYTYDNVGNILTGNGHTYTYGDTLGWADLLTAVDGQTITYDNIGNPTSYYNGTRWAFTWEQGRQLATASDGTNSISYTYDADGLRTSKTVNGTKHTYYYAGGKLLRETYGDTVLDFFYDANGNAHALKYNGTLYYYITNLQGDVMSIVDAQGAVVAEYEYDPYGNVITAADELAETNPLRYRGYYYDTETGLYYVSSRYYDPEIGRFINADAFASTGQGIIGNNMFAYCGNNPVVRADPSGESFAIVLGFNFNLFGWGMIGTINLVSTEENFGVQYSYYISDDPEISEKSNQTIGVDVGPYVGVQYTDKKSMEELEGYAKATGGDLILGIDVLTEEDGDYLGWQFGSSVFSANMHSLYTNTETLFSVPTLDLVEIIVDWIFEEK